MPTAPVDASMATRYSAYYSAQDPVHLYPVEFVVRAFLGTYPQHRFDRSLFPGQRVLDLGFGDGRNFPLLARLGFELYGVEISEDIIRSAQKLLAHHQLAPHLAVGANARIPFPDAYFGFVLGCHSCYYVEEGTSFDDNLREIRRVLAPNGHLIVSLPMPGSHILQSAVPLGGGHFRITSDRYRVRNGIIMRSFQDEREITETFSLHFTDLRTGFTDDFYWGTRQQVWVVICRAA